MALISVLGASSPASAQSYLADAALGLGTGFEGGGGEGPSVAWQRARTQIWSSLELRIDERPKTGYQGRVFVELERGLSVGGELGVTRQVLSKVRVFGGGVMVLAPRSLFGGTVRGHYLWELSSGLTLSPFVALSALPVGSDVPADSGVFWFNVGIGVESAL